MLIDDPVSNFFSNMIAKRHRYRCIVDGCDEFRGERLPVGTEEDILAWIKARYKILGELWAIRVGGYYGTIFCRVLDGGFSPLWFHSETWHPPHETKRYLVEVAEVEKVFILRPFPDGLLEWSAKGMLESKCHMELSMKTIQPDLTKEFIKEVMSVPSCSGKEAMLREFIERFADERGISHCRDRKGNLYLTKGESDGCFPCLANHMDTVQCWQGELVDTRELIDVRERIRNGHTELYATEGGIGADDKLGCAIALALIDVLPVVKAAFFVEEELCMRGSKELDRNWFSDVGFCLSFDSPGRNRSSRTCAGRRLYSDAFFAEVLSSICARHGVTDFNDEPFTDVTQIRDQTRVMCYNVGNGGCRAHCPDEYLVVEDAQSAFSLGKELLETVGTCRHWF